MEKKTGYESGKGGKQDILGGKMVAGARKVEVGRPRSILKAELTALANGLDVNVGEREERRLTLPSGGVTIVDLGDAFFFFLSNGKLKCSHLFLLEARHLDSCPVWEKQARCL